MGWHTYLLRALLSFHEYHLNTFPLFFFFSLPAFGSLNFCCWGPCAQELSSFQIRRPFWMVQMGYLGGTYLFCPYLFCKIVANCSPGCLWYFELVIFLWFHKKAPPSLPTLHPPSLLPLFSPRHPLLLDLSPISSLSGWVFLCSRENSKDNFKAVGRRGKVGHLKCVWKPVRLVSMIPISHVWMGPGRPCSFPGNRPGNPPAPDLLGLS